MIKIAIFLLSVSTHKDGTISIIDVFGKVATVGKSIRNHVFLQFALALMGLHIHVILGNPRIL